MSDATMDGTTALGPRFPSGRYKHWSVQATPGDYLTWAYAGNPRLSKRLRSAVADELKRRNIELPTPPTGPTAADLAGDATLSFVIGMDKHDTLAVRNKPGSAAFWVDSGKLCWVESRLSRWTAPRSALERPQLVGIQVNAPSDLPIARGDLAKLGVDVPTEVIEKGYKLVRTFNFRAGLPFAGVDVTCTPPEAAGLGFWLAEVLAPGGWRTRTPRSPRTPPYPCLGRWKLADHPGTVGKVITQAAKGMLDAHATARREQRAAKERNTEPPGTEAGVTAGV